MTEMMTGMVKHRYRMTPLEFSRARWRAGAA
jgi:hypothetical protein